MKITKYDVDRWRQIYLPNIYTGTPTIIDLSSEKGKKKLFA